MNGADSRPEWLLDSLYFHSFVYIQKDDVGILGENFPTNPFFLLFCVTKGNSPHFFLFHFFI